ncbi:unnamed protein product [Candida verbasci]|uniref:Protein HIR n=1 Tax=Candida verbasci TaxID=1227364 RepID=A0A9W4XBU2_9ASCO|nr:unnamed protein product [Candida verbasci]
MSLPHIVKWINPRNFLSCDTQGHIYTTNIESNQSKKIYPITEPEGRIIDLSIVNDLIAFSLSNGKIHIMDLTRNTIQELTKLCPEKELIIQRSISFDNSNNYLISIGDDTQINLFQYVIEEGNYKFRLINKIEKLFSKNPLNVKYKRISWSPDSDLVTIPTASKSQTTLISLLSKSNNWNNKISLVGHDLTCEVTRFSPNIYSETENDENLYTVIASGGSDKTLSIWNTSKTTPIILLQDCIDGEILDLKWVNQGNNIIFVTSNGHFCLVEFEKYELGYIANEETVDKLKKLQSVLVKPLNFRYDYESLNQGNLRRALPQIEYVDQKDAIKIDNLPKETKKKGEEEEEEEEKEVKEETKRIEPIISIKKGSIEPETIPLPKLDLTETNQNHQQQPEKPEKPEPLPKVNSVKKKSQSPITVTETSTRQLLQNQKITTKDGKKRVQPMLLSTNNNSTQQQQQPKQSSSTPQPQDKSTMEFEKASYSVSDNFHKSNKRKNIDENGHTKKSKREMEPIKFIGSVILNPNTTFSKLRLAIPKIRFSFQLKSKNESELFVLDIRNGSGNEIKPSRITYFKKDKEVWCDFIPRYIQLAAEGSNFWAISTNDGTILTYSQISGKRLLPPIIMGSPLSFLESNKEFLMAVTSIGELQVWNINTKKSILKCSISTILELGNKFQDDGLLKGDNITMCAITSSGTPLVTLSNGSGYLYNSNFETWQSVSESWWCFGSHYWNSNEKPQTTDLFGKGQESIIELLEYKTNEEVIRKTRIGRGKYFNKISKNMIMKEGFESLENTISLSHLENRILCAEILREDSDFHKFFIVYIQRICELGFKTKLFEICSELYGPDNDDYREGWKGSICGFEKRELLKEVINLCSGFRDCQRVLIHFSKKLNLIE